MLPRDLQKSSSLPPASVKSVPPSGSILKEKELLQKQEENYLEEGKELELEKEIKEAGVERLGEEISLPEPVREMGVELSGPSTPLSPPSFPSIPLTQKQIKKALHKKITDSLLWLAYWCLRQLKIRTKKFQNS